MMAAAACVFCEVIAGHRAAHTVLEDPDSLAFLDHRPLFPGHVLLVPKAHLPTLLDVPASVIGPFFTNVRLLALAVEQALEAEGAFIAMNHRVSQSVPHLHVHIVPRRRGDGLKGFFWPRQRYEGPDHLRAVQQAIRRAIASVRAGS
jgi:histidine triad (HIT) family protein